MTLELDHRFSVEGEGGTSGGVRRAAAGSVVDLQLEQVRRRLSKDAKGEDGAAFDDGWNDMLNPQVRKEVRAAEQAAQQGPLFGNPLLDAVPRETAYELPDGLGAFVSGSFETPYAGENVRISRGTFGGPIAELRIFERVGQAKAKVYATWQEEEDALAAASAAGQELGEFDDRWQEGGFEEQEAMDFADDYDYDDYGAPDS